jgi:DNA polymerase I
VTKRPVLYLIDASSNIHRAYHAIRELRNSKGHPTNATYGFLNMLRKMLREHQPDYLAAAFDLPGKTVRHEAYAAYKAQRKPMDEDLAVQLPDVRRVCDAYRIPILEAPGYEADDVIGTLARRAVDEGFDVVIVTSDKDMLQLVEGSRVRVYHTGRERFLDEEGTAEFFGVPPSQVVDVLALMGDTSDNVPGVPKIGEVTAKKLIKEYGDLDTLLARAPEIKGKVGESLVAHKKDALFSRDLVRIVTKLDLPFDPISLKIDPPDKEKLAALFAELEFHSLLDELRAEPKDFEALEVTRLSPGEKPPLAGPRIGVGFLPREPGGLMAFSDGAKIFLAEEEAASLAGRLRELSAGATLASADTKPLHAVLHAAGLEVEVERFFDLALARYTLAPGVANTEFAALAIDLLRRKSTSDKDAGVADGRLPRQFEPNAAAQWLAERAAWAPPLAAILEKDLAARPELDAAYRQIEMPLVPVLARMESAGVKIDAAYLSEMSRAMESELARLETTIWEEAGEQFNINSPQQLGRILFEKLGYPVLKKTTKTKTYATGVEVLSEFASQGRTLPARVLEYREIAKLKGTYVDALPQLADAGGRVHTSFRQAVAATGRLSSQDPNLQNIPVRTDTGRAIRRAFVAEAGSRLIVADYSQIELRILAHLSQDEALIAAFERGDDIHRATAAKVFGVAPDLISLEMRIAAKRINFGLLYGMGAFSLSKDLGISGAEAKKFIEAYFAQFPRVRSCLDRVLEEARSTGEVRTVFGRIRPIPEIRASNGAIRANAERMALNAPFQGSAADIIKKAMIRVDRRLRQERLAARLILQVHDELLVEAEDSAAPAAAEALEQEMQQAAALAVPLAVDIGSGSNWLEAKG